MASRYYGVNKGQAQKTSVAENSSTNSKDVELVIDLTTNAPSKNDVLTALEAIKEKIVEANWPPA